jgi:hypothetical protein
MCDRDRIANNNITKKSKIVNRVMTLPIACGENSKRNKLVQVFVKLSWGFRETFVGFS